MASTLVDLVKITANSTGTGAITLGAAVPGYFGIEKLTNGAQYSYVIQQNDTAEVGTGIYLSSTNQLVRTPTQSTNGGTAVNLAPNAEVAFVARAEDLTAAGGAASLAAVDLSNVNWGTLPSPTVAGIGQALVAGNAFPAITGPYFDFSSPNFTLESLGSVAPPNGVYIGHGGNSLSFQTLISSPSGTPDLDNQRATMLIRATTSDDGNSEEQTLCLLTTIQTGYSKQWATLTAFSAADNVRVNGNVYRCTTPGTSAATGTGPSGTGLAIADGTVVWKWINETAIDAKCAFYNEVEVKPGAGNSWAQANNIQVNSGVLTDFAVNTELDFSNNCGIDSNFGGLNKYNLLITTVGSNVSTACVEINTRNTTVPAALWALHFSLGPLASHSVIGIDASAPNGISFGVNGGGVVNPTFTNSVINDSSNAPVGIALSGAYSAEAINISGTTPAALSISGTKSFASIFDTANSPSAFIAAGVYSSSAFSVTAISDPAAYSSSGTNSLAAFFDSSTSPTALLLQGNYSAEAISVSGVTPTALSITGSKTFAAVFDQSTTPFAYDFAGTYGKSPIKFTTAPPSYASNAAAASAGLDVGGVFLINGAMMVRA